MSAQIVPPITTRVDRMALDHALERASISLASVTRWRAEGCAGIAAVELRIARALIAEAIRLSGAR